MVEINTNFETASQPTPNLSPSDFVLIAEALEHYGHNLLYAHEDINTVELKHTAKLHEEISNYLDKNHPTIATSVN